MGTHIFANINNKEPLKEKKKKIKVILTVRRNYIFFLYIFVSLSFAVIKKKRSIITYMDERVSRNWEKVNNGQKKGI